MCSGVRAAVSQGTEICFWLQKCFMILVLCASWSLRLKLAPTSCPGRTEMDEVYQGRGCLFGQHLQCLEQNCTNAYSLEPQSSKSHKAVYMPGFSISLSPFSQLRKSKYWKGRTWSEQGEAKAFVSASYLISLCLGLPLTPAFAAESRSSFKNCCSLEN